MEPGIGAARDSAWMLRALALAEATVGLTSPNPQVGCVLVRDGRVLGEGAHRFAERDHAEIVALKQAAALGHDARGATAYVTLEPCSHHGRTGPCADALIAAGIARSVVATVDPNPEVTGRGLARLRAAGIEVELGLCETPARTLNDGFAFSVRHGRPFVTLKAAVSADGMLAPAPAKRTLGEPSWLTGPEARAEVHRLRHAADALVTGIGTVLADDPLLTDRSGLLRRRPLLRAVLDRQARTPPDAKLLRSAQDGGPVWIFCATGVEPGRMHALETAGARLIVVPADPRLSLPAVLDHLAQNAIRTVLLEAGSRLNGAFLRGGVVEAAALFTAPVRLGAEAVPFAEGSNGPFALGERLLDPHLTQLGPDRLLTGLVKDPWEGLSLTGGTLG